MKPQDTTIGEIVVEQFCRACHDENGTEIRDPQRCLSCWGHVMILTPDGERLLVFIKNRLVASFGNQDLNLNDRR